MAKTMFPVPTSGTAWASGGISGRVGLKGGGVKRSKRNSFARKPWESQNWIPYIGAFNNNAFATEDGGTPGLYLQAAGDVIRVVNFVPSAMDEDTLLPTYTGRVATESAWKIRRVQGILPFAPMWYDDTHTWIPDAASLQAGAFQRVWWSWQKEQTTTSAYQQNISDMGVGPSVLSGAKQLTSRHLLNWGVVDYTRPPVSAAGVFQGGGSREVEDSPAPHSSWWFEARDWRVTLLHRPSFVRPGLRP